MIEITPNTTRKKIFLAGPIKGAPNWQRMFVETLKTVDNDYIIANPRRDDVDDNFDLNSQIDWETYHLRTADYIVFYIPEPEYDVEGRDYAQTTRFELGENLALCNGTDKKIFVCIKKGFPGRSYIKYKIEKEYPENAIWFEEMYGDGGLINTILELGGYSSVSVTDKKPISTNNSYYQYLALASTNTSELCPPWV